MYWFIMTLPLSLLCLVCYMGGRCHGFKQARDTFKPLLDDVMKQNGEMFEFICDINNWDLSSGAEKAVAASLLRLIRRVVEESKPEPERRGPRPISDAELAELGITRAEYERDDD